jgi:uncharacterized hydrophobic protein (TIGR00271 family)
LSSITIQLKKLGSNFQLKQDVENVEVVIESLEKEVTFKETNLWVLIFAILLASLGLNINSTAVVIGAMLISPLMGPIIGIGLGLGINDLALVKKAFGNYIFAVSVSLVASTLYFLLSPINEAHSELLARTSPNIYDVLIALFGGFAGCIVSSSKKKGNVLQGVAIATALMPPLCTAGYGIASLQFQYIFGALYLFVINSVFIALATLITIRYLKFPLKSLSTEKDEKKAKRMVWLIVSLTLLPSIYLGYVFVQENKYKLTVEKFILKEAVLKDDYLLSKSIDFKTKTILLTYGGRKITSDEIKHINDQLKNYDLSDSKVIVNQGFSSLGDINKNEHFNQVTHALKAMDEQLKRLTIQLDSLKKDSVAIAIKPKLKPSAK